MRPSNKANYFLYEFAGKIIPNAITAVSFGRNQANTMGIAAKSASGKSSSPRTATPQRARAQALSTRP